ncbi:MAG TPA: hypothetical protein VNH18_32995 [Bryobacteraceae bacterium]|nr:hypothetical protein [Bryobacteraceae bacterium]HXJ44151.1 hypothetical protein [Bryobacteraceae bacterium]
MSFISRPVFCGAIILTAWVRAAEIEPAARVAIVDVPSGGEAVEAKITARGTIHLLYNFDGIPYYVKSSNHGASFSSPLRVVNVESRKPGLVFSGEALAVGKGDAVYVAMSTNNWKLKLPNVPEGLVYATLTPGAKAFTPARSFNQRPSEGFSLAADDNGNVAATWLAGKLYANLSRDGGKTFTANAEINPAYNPCDCCTTQAAFGADGDLAVLYREETNNERDMYLVLLANDGSQSRTRVSSTLWKINGCPMTYFALSTTKEGYIAAWPTKGEIYFARLDRNGRVLPPGEIKTAGRSGMRSGVVALSASDGTTLIAWRHQEEVTWQIYDLEGRPQGALGSIKSAGKGAAGIVDEKGRFILFR